MSKFPTDKKVSNLQIYPTGKHAISIFDSPLLVKKTENNEWEIPLSMYPVDYYEINISQPEQPNYKPSVTVQDGYVIMQDHHVISFDNNGIKTFYINLDGLYKFNTGSKRLDHTNLQEFNNDESGFEIVESKNEDSDFIYTIKPNTSQDIIRLTSNEISLGFIQICSCFIKPHDEFKMKITGEIPEEAYVYVKQNANLFSIEIDFDKRYIHYDSIISHSMYDSTSPYIVYISTDENPTQPLSQPLYIPMTTYS